MKKKGAGSLWKFKTTLLSVSGVIVFVLLWWAESALHVISSLFLPSPITVARSLIDLANGPLWSDLGVSLEQLILGFALGASVGVLGGLLMGRFRTAAQVLRPFVAGGYTIPLLAVLPLFIVWFGIGMLSKVILIAVGSFFPVIVNTEHGVASTPKVIIQASENLGATEWQLFWRVLVRNGTPFILTGLRLGFGLGLLLVVAAEMLGGTSGIGFQVLNAGNLGDTPQVIALIIVFALLGILSVVLFEWLQRFLCPWSERSRAER